MNHYFTSDGERLTEKTIQERLTRAYNVNKVDYPMCEGCGKKAESRAHIIAKSRCKQIRKVELIYDWNNIFYACFSCNLAIENPKGDNWLKLKNITKCLDFIQKHDPELYAKFMVNS